MTKQVNVQTDFNKIKNYDSEKLIKKAKIGFGSFGIGVLSDSQTDKIRQGEKDIDKANHELVKASDDSEKMTRELNDNLSEIDDAENDQTEVQEKGAAAESKMNEAKDAVTAQYSKRIDNNAKEI